MKNYLEIIHEESFFMKNLIFDIRAELNYH